MTDTKPFPTLSKKNHLGIVETHDATDEADYKAHLALGFLPEYEHQEFPFVLHKSKGRSKSVANQAELDEALKAGWQEKPIPAPSEDEKEEE